MVTKFIHMEGITLCMCELITEPTHTPVAEATEVAEAVALARVPVLALVPVVAEQAVARRILMRMLKMR